MFFPGSIPGFGVGLSVCLSSVRSSLLPLSPIRTIERTNQVNNQKLTCYTPTVAKQQKKTRCPVGPKSIPRDTRMSYYLCRRMER
uniref:Putative secreted protein n=1 Tax=Anopheles marajoara TaxID=58244 RepID=A0A2M4CB33_9DIPT